MHRDDRASLRGECRLDRLRSHRPAVAVYIGESGCGPDRHHRTRCRDERPRRDDHLVAGSHAERPKREFEGERAVRDRYRMRAAQLSGVPALELPTLRARPVVDRARPNHVGDRSGRLLAGSGPSGHRSRPDGGASVYRERVAHSATPSEWSGRAGTPAQVACAGTSRVIAAPAPTIAQSPTAERGIAHEPTPTSAPSPIETPPHSATPGPTCAWSPMMQSWSTRQPVLSTASRPIRVPTFTMTPGAM